MISSLPKFLNLEKGVGVETAHAELTGAFERYLYSVEPASKRKPATRKRLGDSAAAEHAPLPVSRMAGPLFPT